MRKVGRGCGTRQSARRARAEAPRRRQLGAFRTKAAEASGERGRRAPPVLRRQEPPLSPAAPPPATALSGTSGRRAAGRVAEREGRSPGAHARPCPQAHAPASATARVTGGAGTSRTRVAAFHWN